MTLKEICSLENTDYDTYVNRRIDDILNMYNRRANIAIEKLFAGKGLYWERKRMGAIKRHEFTK